MSLGTDAIKGWEGALEYTSQWGVSMATLWAGTSLARYHQPAPSHWRNLSGETYQTLYLPQITSYEGWEGLGAELAK